VSRYLPAAPAPTQRHVDRRGFLGLLGGAAVTLGLAACGSDDTSTAAALKPTDPLPTTIPSGTALNIASGQQQEELALRNSGLIDKIPFKVSSWPNLSAGPDVINGFRAKSVDLARNAGIPPIQAHFQDIGARIVAVNLTRNPIYVFATKPGSDIASVADFRGKKLAFSQGQAQGVVLLRALKQAGISYKDVTLVPLTSNQFLTALQAKQVDIAPLWFGQVPTYLEKYAKDGAKTIKTDVVDRLDVLWAPDKVLADAAKVAAIKEYIPIWAQAQVWVWENHDTWIDKYYVESQGLTRKQGEEVVAFASKPLYAPTWDEALQWEQSTVDLLAEGGFVKSFDASTLFDRRFEGITSDAVPAEYRS
jgi:sulfonate transport system substrate-binding protein